MSISDPAAQFIGTQQTVLTDFIFRITGDRSRAGIIASEVCKYVHRELLSGWSMQDIKVELFSYAYQINSDALRGIEREFLEAYYRDQVQEPAKVSLFYPIELFFVEVGPTKALTLVLKDRFHFSSDEIARILDKSQEEVEEDLAEIPRLAKAFPKIQLDEVKNLPAYNFLSVPDPMPTALSQILVSMSPRRLTWRLRVLGALIFGGLIVGWMLHLFLKDP